MKLTFSVSTSVLLSIFWLTTAFSNAQAGTVLGNKGVIMLSESTRAGDVLLDPGTYQVQHVLDGTEHFMTFTKMRDASSIPRMSAKAVRTKCWFRPLVEKPEHTELHFAHAADQRGEPRILKELLIKDESFVHILLN